MVGIELSETPRSHHDIEKETGNFKYMKKAQKFYTAVAKRAATVGHAPLIALPPCHSSLPMLQAQHAV